MKKVALVVVLLCVPLAVAQFVINPYRFGSAPVLDNYTSNLVAAWSSSRRVLSSYTGTIITVRDSTSTTEYNIGYLGNNDLDAATLASSISTHSATLKTIYDQSGNTRDATQATTTRQPVIAVSGTIEAINSLQAFTCDNDTGGTNKFLGTPSTAHGIGTGDYFLTMIVRSPGTLGGGYEGMFGFSSFAPGFYFKLSSGKLGVFSVSDKAFSSTLTTSTTYVLSFARESGTLKAWVNGTLEAATPAESANIPTTSIGLLATSAVVGNDPCLLTMQECFLWASNMSASRAAIMAEQITRAGL